jgi:tetratricopeptide (TPR) repeat protein
MLKLFLVCLFFFCSLVSVFAQNKRVMDSLVRSYQTAKQDTSKILTLVAIATEYQKDKPDSALQLTQQVLEQSLKLKYLKGQQQALYVRAIAYYTKGNYDIALSTLQQSLELAKQGRDHPKAAACLASIGIVYLRQANYATCITYCTQSLSLSAQHKDQYNLIAPKGLGLAHFYMGNYPSAIDFFQKALQIAQKTADFKECSSLLINTGLAYSRLANLALALTQYQQALIYCEKTGEQLNKCNVLSNIATIYFDLKNIDQALIYSHQALNIAQALKNKRMTSVILGNMGNGYEKKKDYGLALTYYQQSLALKEELGDKRGITYTLNGMANLYGKQGNYEQSIATAKKGLQIAQELKILAEIEQLSMTLYDAYKSKGDYAEALFYYELNKVTKDSLFNIEKAKTLANLESKFALEKKEKEMALLAKDNELNKLNIEKQSSQLVLAKQEAETARLLSLSLAEKNKRKADSLSNLAEKAKLAAANLQAQKEKQALAHQVEIAEQTRLQTVYLGLSAVFVAVILIVGIGLWQKHKANRLLFVQNRQIVVQKQEIEEKNQELEQTSHQLMSVYENITASINYAQRIQYAILLTENSFRKYFANSFIIFKPRDTVSGDFYWATAIDNLKIVAAADCTGHGVPGAFMSMIGNDLLNQTVIEKNITQPNEILTELNRNIFMLLKQEEQEKVQDGMDIAVCAFYETEKYFQYAGAMNPLYYIANQQFIEIKADKQSIGGHGKASKKFTLHTFPYQSPTTLYLFSDGYQDQFGGVNKRKFMVKKLKELLASFANQPLDTQKQILEETFENWRGTGKQIDDVMAVVIQV